MEKKCGLEMVAFANKVNREENLVVDRLRLRRMKEEANFKMWKAKKMKEGGSL